MVYLRQSAAILYYMITHFNLSLLSALRQGQMLIFDKASAQRAARIQSTGFSWPRHLPRTLHSIIHRIMRGRAAWPRRKKVSAGG